MNSTSFFTRATMPIVALVAFFLLSSSASAGPPTEFVKVKSDALISILNQPVSPKRTASLKTEVRELVAYDELARRSLGDHWTKRNDDERKQFIALLEELVELNYANKFSGESGNLKYVVSYSGEKLRASTGQSIVKTEVDYGSEKILVDYKLLEKKANVSYVIYDIVFDDVSLEETYRESYVPIIDKEGWGSLIKRMNAKLDELKAKK
jgi:ABC-type transporter MlaC component